MESHWLQWDAWGAPTWLFQNYFRIACFISHVWTASATDYADYPQVALTSNISLHSSATPSSKVSCHASPAVLMQMSSRPYLPRINSNIAVMSASLRRSHCAGQISPGEPDFFTSSANTCADDTVYVSKWAWMNVYFATHYYVIVRPLSTVEYTSVASVFHSRQWSDELNSRPL